MIQASLAPLLCLVLWHHANAAEEGEVSKGSTIPKQVITEMEDAKGAKAVHEGLKNLSKLGPEAAPTLRECARDKGKDPGARSGCLSQLSKVLGEDSDKELAEILRQPDDPQFRTIVAMRLGETRTDTAKKLLGEVIADKKEDSYVRMGAAYGLAKMGDPRGKEAALEAILTLNPMREIAMMALAELKAMDVIPRLEKATKGKDPKSASLKEEVVIAKTMILMAGEPEENSVGRLSSLFRQQLGLRAWQWASRKLVEIGSPPAGKALAMASKDSKAPGAYYATAGLHAGIQQGVWTEQQIQEWLK